MGYFINILGICIVCSHNKFLTPCAYDLFNINFTPLNFSPPYIFLHMILDILQRVTSLGNSLDILMKAYA
jgi:hypothetical protein